MMTHRLAMAWLQLLALLAAEVALIAVVVALPRHWSASAAWSRTFCQAGIVAVLVLTSCELSGSARVLGGWAARTLVWRHGEQLPGRSATPGTPGCAWPLPTRPPSRRATVQRLPAPIPPGDVSPRPAAGPAEVFKPPGAGGGPLVGHRGGFDASFVAVPGLGDRCRAGGGAGVPGPVPVCDIPAPAPHGWGIGGRGPSPSAGPGARDAACGARG